MTKTWINRLVIMGCIGLIIVHLIHNNIDAAIPWCLILYLTISNRIK